MFSFRDRHIEITNEQLYEDNVYFKKENGGSFGMSTIQLDDDSVLVSFLLKGGSAEKAGIRLGAEILKWNGQDAKKAYLVTEWSDYPFTTEADRQFNQGRFMTRAPVGKRIVIEYRNITGEQDSQATMTAVDDQFATLKQTKIKLTKEDPPIISEIINGQYGYFKINYFLPSKKFPKPALLLVNQIHEFEKKEIKHLIIDVRDNPGGDDGLVTEIAGHFVNEERFYEYASYYNRFTQAFEINRMETYTIQPRQPYFAGDIIILINNRTVSSGEGLPMALKGLPNVMIVGFTPTNGSFGVVSSPILVNMPGGYTIQLPDGRSLNKDKNIQGDVDRYGQGGVTPDIRIPLNAETSKPSI
ncbi:S41 family peptidase [Paenibacillus sp. LPE1-1-1.1]|uniref:S41 family peptidase n=1 Tax=Paenibacillus sp. LPE1-1-1.1 TaxID=3135230 RepID=UPI0034315EEF